MLQLKVKNDNKYGVIDENNKILIPPEYDKIGVITNGLAKVKLAGKWGVVNFENKIIVPLEYDKWNFSLLNNFIIVEDYVDNCKKFGAYNKDGKFILNIEFDEISAFRDSLVCYKGNKLYVYDIYGKEDDETKDKYMKKMIRNKITKGKYESLKNENDKYGFHFIITIGGTTSIDNLFPYVSDYPIVELNDYKFYAKIKNDNKYGIISRNGTIIVPLEYDEIDFIFDDNIIVVKDGKYGMINYKTNKILIPLEHDYLEWSIFSN